MTGAGAYLLVSGDDPDRYEGPRYQEAARSFVVTAYVAPQGGGVALAGRF